MLTIDKHIQLAEQIAKWLPEVTRNEWMAWVQIAQKSGFERAVRWAEHLSQDITMRPSVNRANRLIAAAMKTHLKQLRSLEIANQWIVLGYVAWFLVVQTRRGSMRS